MSDPCDQLNAVIQAASPALLSALSPLGLRVAFPPDIPFQAAEARSVRLNATIGQITDGKGAPARLPTLSAPFEGLAVADLDRAFLYSPVEGLAELRHAWQRWQRQGVDRPAPTTLPLVTAGLTHGLSLVADLFGSAGRPMALMTPFWGNYRQTFSVRTGIELLAHPAFRAGQFDPEAIQHAVAGRPTGEPTLALLNLPSNPGGYMPTRDQRTRLVESLLGVAADRPLVVICDDAYQGLVYERDIPRRSLFWDLCDRHPNLVPVKIDGATKEFSFFGGRVGFVTFGFAADSPVAAALESKLKCLVRATIGSPVATSQMILLQGLREHGIGEEVESIRRMLERRYRVLASALAKVDRQLLRPLPFNAGCFALLEIPPELALTADQIRKHLLATEDTGVIAIGQSHLRIAFCSVDETQLPELVERLERGVRALIA